MTSKYLKQDRDGRQYVWLGGEMEFPFGMTAMEAYYACVKIANACGYMVSQNGQSSFSVTGGDIIGYLVLEWYDRERPGPEKIEHWTCQTTYHEPEDAVAAKAKLQEAKS